MQHHQHPRSSRSAIFLGRQRGPRIRPLRDDSVSDSEVDNHGEDDGDGDDDDERRRGQWSTASSSNMDMEEEDHNDRRGDGGGYGDANGVVDVDHATDDDDREFGTATRRSPRLAFGEVTASDGRGGGGGTTDDAPGAGMKKSEEAKEEEEEEEAERGEDVLGVHTGGGNVELAARREALTAMVFKFAENG